MLVANNTFVDLYGVVFVVGYDSANFSGSIDGMRIVNNIASMSSGAKIFNVSTALSTVTIDYNLAWTTGAYGSTPDGRSTTSAATFNSWTGYQANGVNKQPGIS